MNAWRIAGPDPRPGRANPSRESRRRLARAKFHVVRYLPAGPRTIPAGLFKGLRMHLDPRNDLQLYLGLFEREIAASITGFTKECVTAIDVGAGKGEYTLLFLRHDDVARVYAFEPNEASRTELNRNLMLNPALPGNKLELSAAPIGSGKSGTLTLDSLCEEISGPCVVKIDVEGMEAEVLEGACRLLMTVPLLLVVETHSAELERRCLALLASCSYQTRIVDHAWWRRFLPELRPLSLNRWVVAEKTW